MPPPAASVPVDRGTWVIDLDGVVWLAQEPISGGDVAIARLRAAGIRPLFVTNNSSPTVAELVARLARAGIAAGTTDVVTSAQAAATLLLPGDRAFVCADAGVAEALATAGVDVVTEGPVDAVVVGWTRRFDFDLLASAAGLVRAGARLIGTNEDATHPTPGGLLPGSGALLAAVSAAAERPPEVAGKPHAPMAALVGSVADDVTLVIGDRPSTDGALATRLHVPFGHVRSAVTDRGDDDDDGSDDRNGSGAGGGVVVADVVADDLVSLVDRILGG